MKDSLQKAILVHSFLCKKRRIEKVCPICGRAFSVPPSLNRLITCSISCRNKLRWRSEEYRTKQIVSHLGKQKHWRGKKHKKESIEKMQKAHFNGKEKIIKNGYVFVFRPDHPRAHCGRVPEQILIAEEMLGRYLRDDETVHHINQIKDDNRKENLLICTKKYHRKLHAELKGLGRYIQPKNFRDPKTGRFLPKKITETR